MALRTINIFKKGTVWVAQKSNSNKILLSRSTQKEAFYAVKPIAKRDKYTITVYSNNNRTKKIYYPTKPKDESCFITTACVKHHGLSDSCWELNTLRKFRDLYLINTEHSSVIEYYYKVAPVIVRKIDLDINSKKIYSYLFKQIRSACNHIDNGNYTKAKSIYFSVVISLASYYKHN